MLIVFEIDDNNMSKEAASMLAQRETLWVFSKEWRVYSNQSIQPLDEMFIPKVEEPKKSTKRTTAKKGVVRKINGTGT